MAKQDNRQEIINAALAQIATKSQPTVVEINERIKRKYFI